MRAVERGTSVCAGEGCPGHAQLSVLVQVMSFGGRKKRSKASSGALRMCKGCLDDLAKGKMSAKLVDGTARAIRKVREGQE